MEAKVQESQIRANLFRVFSSFFLVPPLDSFLTELASNPIVEFPLGTSWDLEEINLEFHSLFLVPADRYLFPYESCYVGRVNGRPGRLLGKPAREVQGWYSRAGLGVDARASELPDHAGLEFGFLQRLAEAEMSSWTQGDDDQAHYWRALQAGFFEQHVACWIPDLCVELKASSNLPYFVSFADWIVSAIEEIRRSGFVPPGSELDGFSHADSRV